MLIPVAIDEKSLLQSVSIATEANNNNDLGIPVPDYVDENVSIKGEMDEEKKNSNKNNIHIINNNKDNNNQEKKEDSSNNIMNFIYKEPKPKENKTKRRNLSEEAKRNKDNDLDMDSMKNKFKEKGKKFKIKNLEEDKEYKQLKEDIDKGTNFIDYFLVIGVEPEDFFDEKIYECDIDELKSKYKDKLQPKIISYFPKFEKKTIAFDDSIISHCFPNGFNVIKSNKMPKTEIFSFILDNNYFNLNYPQKYLSCLICYESMNKYRILYEEYKKFSENDETNKEEDNKKPK